MNMPFLKITLPLIICLLGNSAVAGTLIEVVGKNGSQTQVMMDGKKSRIDMGREQGYVLIDYDRQTMLAVIPEQKQILDMSGDMPSLSGRSVPRVRTELIPGGRGPAIAGYSTEMFKLKANGKACGTLFGSKAAMETAGIANLFNSMKAMVEKQRAAMGSYAAMMDDCTRANMDFASYASKMGVPMRMLDNRGNVVSEIKSINTNVALPANAFTLPKGYKTVTMAEQMNGTRQGIKQAQRQMPGMKQTQHSGRISPDVLKQMQQSGRIPPEAMEQIKQYQRMMQQQGR
jgi:hypothetical protein